MQPARKRIAVRDDLLDMLPEWAPLSRPYLHHLFHSRKHLHLPEGYKEGDARIWENFVRVRRDAYSYMYPYVRAERVALDTRLGMKWLQTAIPLFDPLRRVPSPKTIFDWQTRNLLIQLEHANADPNSVAALLIMRGFFTLSRNWLPGEIPKNEPLLYIWGIQPQETEPCKFAWPLQQHLAANTLLYSTWSGMRHLPGWRPISEYGAAAWAGAIDSPHSWLTLDQMEQWDPQFVQESEATLFDKEHINAAPFSRYLPLSFEVNVDARLQDMTNELLMRVGSRRMWKHLTLHYQPNSPFFRALGYNEGKSES